ncbi:MOSC domain-containing protein [Cellvibrio sp. OA-2007]|uniref:MOSC domain-containing protein n=1 Tax=Cellvibrio sp. OA-2007 TaxID=529823 RepID=UPI0007843248|nr:MOSC domain-containing protein [Cellvibrio sp. OA-2007]
MNTQARLLDKLCANIAPGKLEWIGLRSERRGEVVVVEQAEAVVDLGLVGDHRMKKSPGSARQVTLISREYIQQICQHTGLPSIDPRLLRRNLVISGMNMNLLRYQRLQIGEVIIETNALCHPCSRMDENLGAGGTAAMFGYGGLCAKVIQGGVMRVGDAVIRLALQES